MTFHKYRLLLSLFFGIGFSFLAVGQQKPAFLSDYNKVWVDSVFNSLTLDQKIGQLLMPRGNYSGQPHNILQLKEWVSQYKIGGIVFFAGNPTIQAQITNELQELSDVPLLIGQDFEWGLGMRLDSTDRFPYAATIGAMPSNPELIERMGKEIGKQCKRIGVHINYAPVVDVNNNPNNPVINFRSFSSDKEVVVTNGLAMMKGMQSQGVLCTAKHFPGHGDTEVDSHHDLPIIAHDKKRLNEVELYPFKKLIEQGLSGVMTAHLEVPALESQKGLASTFSKNIVFKLLREDLKFEGLTFTDAMEMKGAVKNFPKGESMVKALLAGNDILETFMDVPTAVQAIKDAISSGKLNMNVINHKVKKILMAKSWVGLDRYQPIKIESLIADLNTIEADIINHQITQNSITCIQDKTNVLPIKDLTKKIAVVSLGYQTESDFYRMVQNYTQADYFAVPHEMTKIKADSVLSTISKYEHVIVAGHFVDIRASKKYGLNPENTAVLKDLSTLPNAIICILGNPFILTKIPELLKVNTLVTAYQQSSYTEMILPQMLFGALPMTGTFPFDISSDLKQGRGLKKASIQRLQYTIPELAGIDRILLQKGLDSLVQVGLVQRAYPGCVLQVAKDGKVIYHKAYGFHTYEAAEKVDMVSQNKAYAGFVDDAMDNVEGLKSDGPKSNSNHSIVGITQKSDVFDLASVTKIMGATLAIMKLMNEQKLSLDDNLGQYVPSVKGSNKENLILRDLLTHRAGLKAWIPFWKDAVDTVATLKKALVLYPDLEKQCLVHIKRPNFFQRLFGKKSTKTIDYEKSLIQNQSLWSQVLKPDTRVWKTNIFSDQSKVPFTITVANNLFLNADYITTVQKQILDSPVTAPGKYVYSDLHYYFYTELVQHLTGSSLENYLYKTYREMGCNSLKYNPTQTISKINIVPTEFDSTFRAQMIHGYVHDEGAAMLGGISGHAGLFGTSNDLMKIMQLYLEKGNYGNKQIIKPEIIQECTQYQFPLEKNRRGIGFDKKDFDPSVQNAPSLFSDQSFGHSGYTGTYAWADPASGISYVFLSNRVYPTRNNNKISLLNIRPNIGDVIVKSIIKILP